MTNLETHCRFDAPIGPLWLAANAQGLTHLLFGARTPEPPPKDGSEAGARWLAQARSELREYFEGARRDFSVPLSPSGTEFQLAVWAALRDIPYGETSSYAALAARIERPTAVRAVGAANGRNPISIIVPCHRVIGADGSLTGYGGGLPAKEALLELEGWTPKASGRGAQMSLFG